jgi:hypothetical protein
VSFTGQGSVTHGKIVYDRRSEGGRFLEIVFEHVVENVHVGEGSFLARTAFHVIANKLESRNTDFVKGDVIAGADVSERKRGSTQIIERREPGAEDRANSVVSLQIDAADAAAPVVEIEIAGKLFAFGLEVEAHGSRGACRRWSFPAEMGGDIGRANREIPALLRSTG